MSKSRTSPGPALAMRRRRSSRSCGAPGRRRATCRVAEDAAASPGDEQTLGGVPSFIKAFPKAGVAGAWQELKGLESAATPRCR